MFSPSLLIDRVCGCNLIVFMFSNLYQLDLHNKTRVALAHLDKTSANLDWNHVSPHILRFIGSACLLISWMDTLILTIVFTIECREVINITWHCPISFKHVSLWCLFFDPCRITYQSNVLGVRLRKEATSDPSTILWMFTPF